MKRQKRIWQMILLSREMILFSLLKGLYQVKYFRSNQILLFSRYQTIIQKSKPFESPWVWCYLPGREVNHWFVLIFYTGFSNYYKDWGPKKVTIYFPIFYLVKSSKSNLFFYLILWLMKLLKDFEKIAILKIGELVSFLGVKIQFGKK